MYTVTYNCTAKADEPRNDFISMLGLISRYLVVLTIFFYFIGWIFINSYYSQFGVETHSLDIPIQYFLIFSCYALTHAFRLLLSFSCLPLLMIILVFMTFFVSLELWPFNETTEQRRTVLTVGLLLLLMVVSYFVAKESGEHCASAKIYHPLHPDTVRLVFKQSDIVRGFPEEFQESLEGQQLRLLTQTKDRIYVFIAPTDSNQGMIRTYDISKDDIYLSIISGTAK